MLLLGICPLALHSQTYSVSGFVKDTGGTPLPYANILLLNADSVRVSGTSSDESGYFSIDGIAPDLYFFQPQYFGYSARPVPVEVRSDLRLGALILSEDAEQLDEVVVTRKRPVIERQADRVVFKVENTVLSSGSTWDILRNAPGVIAGPESLEVRGQPATIYLNGRKVQLGRTRCWNCSGGCRGI